MCEMPGNGSVRRDDSEMVFVFHWAKMVVTYILVSLKVPIVPSSPTLFASQPSICKYAPRILTDKMPTRHPKFQTIMQGKVISQGMLRAGSKAETNEEGVRENRFLLALRGFFTPKLVPLWSRFWRGLGPPGELPEFPRVLSCLWRYWIWKRVEVCWAPEEDKYEGERLSMRWLRLIDVLGMDREGRGEEGKAPEGFS
ncbi:hypothetical protein BDQ17DRAFT_1413100 [Cyathus striatus]|nr:hypothetical protein BDQ17DRAFT_1413100 [Cyathus striatus]